MELQGQSSRVWFPMYVHTLKQMRKIPGGKLYLQVPMWHIRILSAVFIRVLLSHSQLLEFVLCRSVYTGFVCSYSDQIRRLFILVSYLGACMSLTLHIISRSLIVFYELTRE